MVWQQLHLKLDVELVDEEVDGGGGPGPAGVDVKQEQALPLQQGLPLARVLGAFRKLILLLSCHLSANSRMESKGKAIKTYRKESKQHVLDILLWTFPKLDFTHYP